MKTALIENGIVIQTQPPIKQSIIEDGETIGFNLVPANGFVEVPDSVVCGMLDNGDGSFSNPAPTPKSNEQLISELEQSITSRNLRGAALGDEYSINKIRAVEDEINALR